MAKENKDQLTPVDQIIVTSDIDLHQNPVELTDEILKRISNLHPDTRNYYQFTVECQGKTVFHDTKNETIDIRNGAVRVIMTPFISGSSTNQVDLSRFCIGAASK